jgi:hypothetical protein
VLGVAQRIAQTSEQCACLRPLVMKFRELEIICCGWRSRIRPRAQLTCALRIRSFLVKDRRDVRDLLRWRNEGCGRLLAGSTTNQKNRNGESEGCV